MKLSGRNLILTLLLLVIQYQLWWSPYGFSMTQELEREIGLLEHQVKKMTSLTDIKSQALAPEARDELLDEQAREVYHYIAPDEVFMSNSPKNTTH